MDELSKFLIGDTETKQKLQTDIENLNNQLDSLATELKNTNVDDPQYKVLDQQRKDLLDQIDKKTIELESQLKQQRQDYKQALNKSYYNYLGGLSAQDVTDASGRLLTGKEIAMKKGLMDKDYLNAVREQIGQREQGALSTGLKLAKQAQLKGGKADIGNVLAQAENVRRGGSQELTGAVKQEAESAYQKGLAERQAGMGLEAQKYGMQRQDLQEATAQERQDLYGINDRQAQALMNKVQLNASDRSFLQNKISQQIAVLGQKIGLTQNQIAQKQQDLASQPDGFLQQVVKFGATALGSYLGSQIGLGVVGAVKDIGGQLFGSDMTNMANNQPDRTPTGIPLNLYQ